MEKILHIKDVKKSQKYYGIARIGSYAAWIGTIFLNPGTLNTIPFIIAYLTLSILQDKQKYKIPKTIEFNRFLEIYDYIIEEFVKLSKTYEFKSPIELYVLFTLALEYNLLSSQEEAVRINTRFDRELLGATSLNNHGVCRHTSKMLMDIYHKLGFDSTMGICIKPTYETMMKVGEDAPTDEIKKAIEEFHKHLREKAQIDINPDEIMIMPTITLVEREKPLKRVEKKFGNHAITIVNDDNYSYYLDALNKGIYVPKEGTEKEFVDTQGKHIIMHERGQIHFQEKYNYPSIEELPFKNLEDMCEEANKTGNTIVKNKGPAIDFYQEIKEALVEAESIYRLILK